MKVLLTALAVLILMIGAPLLYAETEYQAGFKEGQRFSNDKFTGKNLGKEYDIITQHPHQFYLGWLDGFCILNPHTGSDADEFTFSCSDSRFGAHIGDPQARHPSNLGTEVR